MKRGLVLSVIFISLILLSVSLVSASWFSDFFSKITGKATSSTTCTDTDGGKNYTTKGTVIYKYNYGGKPVTATYIDSCYSGGIKLTEMYCENNQAKSEFINCQYGCSNGTCISSSIQEVDGCYLLSSEVKQKIIDLQSVGNKVILKEGEKANISEYVVVPGYLLKVYTIKNATTGYINDGVKLSNAFNTSEIYQASITAEGSGTITIGGKKYYLTYSSASDSSGNQITLNFPQTASNQIMVFYGCTTEISGCAYINDTIKSKIKELQGYGQNVVLREMDKVNKSEYVVVPGYLLKVDTIKNATTGYINDEVKLSNAFKTFNTSEIYQAGITAEGKGNITIGGEKYYLTYSSASDSSGNQITLNFPQTASNQIMVFNNCTVK